MAWSDVQCSQVKYIQVGGRSVTEEVLTQKPIACPALVHVLPDVVLLVDIVLYRDVTMQRGAQASATTSKLRYVVTETSYDFYIDTYFTL